ncbi:Probable RNA-directed DNA polymerase from transposon X-element [Anthophora plagiata]
MLINETKLKDIDNLRVKRYITIKKCRHNSAGGVSILITQHIPHKIVRSNIRSSIEYVGITLENDIHIFAVYNNPRNYVTETDIQQLTKVGNKVILIGDMNARHRTWNCHVANRNRLTVYKFAHENNCTILHTHEPTHYHMNNSTPKTIDIAINKNIPNITQPIVKNELSSDHRPILFTLGKATRKIPPQTVYTYKNTDSKAFRNTLDQNLEIKNKINNTQVLEDIVTHFTKNIQNTINKVINRKHISTTKDDLPNHIIGLIKRRNKIRKLWQNTRQTHLKIQYTSLTHKITKSIKEHRNAKWENKLKS